jgi:transcription initiation factor TFIID TATA-box-binding protein
MPKDVIKAKIENIVASITLGRDLDLKKLTSSVTGIENPKRFPGVIYRLQEPKCSMLIFRTGKVICSGARNRSQIDEATEKLLAKLKEAKMPASGKPKIEIQNIVASASLDFRVNLDQLAMECENTEYEPEQFPGLIFRLDDPKTVMLVFKTGKMIITGAKTVAQVKLAGERTREILKEINAEI